MENASKNICMVNTSYDPTSLFLTPNYLDCFEGKKSPFFILSTLLLPWEWSMEKLIVTAELCLWTKPQQPIKSTMRHRFPKAFQCPDVQTKSLIVIMKNDGLACFGIYEKPRLIFYFRRHPPEKLNAYFSTSSGEAVSSLWGPGAWSLWPLLGLSANMYRFKWVTEQFRPLTRPGQMLQI